MTERGWGLVCGVWTKSVGVGMLKTGMIFMSSGAGMKRNGNSQFSGAKPGIVSLIQARKNLASINVWFYRRKFQSIFTHTRTALPNGKIFPIRQP